MAPPTMARILPESLAVGQGDIAKQGLQRSANSSE
jgi:hypothetical protein